MLGAAIKSSLTLINKVFFYMYYDSIDLYHDINVSIIHVVLTTALFQLRLHPIAECGTWVVSVFGCGTV